ncbi:MAG: hypothetical protein ACK559_18765, partial [bacterium]
MAAPAPGRGRGRRGPRRVRSRAPVKSTAVRMNTYRPHPYSTSVVGGLRYAMITTSRQGLSTTPRLPDIAVAARASWGCAPALR